MSQTQLDFRLFLERVKDQGYYEIIAAAEDECDRMKSLPDSGSDDADYAHQVEQFLSFLRSGAKPWDIDEREFAVYLPICEALVAKGGFRPAVLKLFDTPKIHWLRLKELSTRRGQTGCFPMKDS